MVYYLLFVYGTTPGVLGKIHIFRFLIDFLPPNLYFKMFAFKSKGDFKKVTKRSKIPPISYYAGPIKVVAGSSPLSRS